jgi:hypothetical protein
MNKQLQEESFNERFEELAAFVSKYGQFPGKSDNPELHNWMLYIRTKYKNGLLGRGNIKLLNALGFIWDIKEWRWFNKAAELKQLLMEEKIMPSVKEHATLYFWLRDSHDRLRNNVLPDNKKAVIEEINRLLNDIQPFETTELSFRSRSKELRWIGRFNDLVEFRKVHRNRWPSFNAITETERKLGIWCQQLRSMFKNKTLEERWIIKLKGIEFSFRRSPLDRWKEKLQELNEYLLCHQKLPASEDQLYGWALTQYRNYFDLGPVKQELLTGINFLQYFMYKSQEHQLAS